MNAEVLNMTIDKESEKKLNEDTGSGSCCCSGGAADESCAAGSENDAGEPGIASIAGVSSDAENELPADQAENDVCCCSGKHKIRNGKEKRDLMNRLKRIEGQVRGLQNMLERDAYCPDILVQASAVNAAINSFSRVLLTSHIRTCVADNIREGNDEVIDELAATLQKMMK